MKGLCRAVILATSMALTGYARADTLGQSAAKPGAADQSVENKTIDFGTGDASTSGSRTGQAAPGDTGFDAGRVALALAGVVGLILLMRAGAKRIFPGTAQPRAAGPLKVLSRCAVSPRQQVLLIQVGKRLLVVGDSGGRLNPLCEINDSAEMALMLSQIRDAGASSARPFGMLFGRARKQFNGQAPLEAAGEMEDETPGESFDATHEIHDPSLAASQRELADLSEKVRDLARQLGDM